MRWFELEKPEWGMPPNPLLEAAAAAASTRSHDSVKSSRMHTHVSAALTEMGVLHHNEKKIGGMLVDIAMIDRKVVVEVDGPHHYCRSDESSMRMLGNYRLKQRHLEAQGWRVVHVPFYEWDPLEPGQQRVYLTHKLELV